MRDMTNTVLADVELRCSCCGDVFVYSAGEQELHAVRGVRREPRECPDCRRLLGRS
jgi:Probable zinc-ribbon domain